MVAPITNSPIGPIDVGPFSEYEPGKDYNQALDGTLDTKADPSNRNQPSGSGNRLDNYTAGPISTDIPSAEYFHHFVSPLNARPGGSLLDPDVDEKINKEEPKPYDYDPENPLNLPPPKDKIGPSFEVFESPTVPGKEPGGGFSFGIGVRDIFGGLPNAADFGQAWQTAKENFRQGWDIATDVMSGAWQGFKQDLSWVGGKIQENALIDRPSILESRDQEKGTKSYSVEEAWNGIKDTFGFGDKPANKPTQKEEKHEPGENNGANGGQVSGADEGVGHNDLPDSF